MILTIDVGNTNITLGVFKPQKVVLDVLPSLHKRWRLRSENGLTADDLAAKIAVLFQLDGLAFSDVTRVVVCSVVPALNISLQQLSKRYFKQDAYLVGQNLPINLKILCDVPSEVGADRLVNAWAAQHIVQGACLIVDFGTATTLDCLNSAKEYAGGLIVPGPLLSAQALAQATAKLPKISWAKPKNLIGKNTIESIQSGLYYGYVALADGLIDKVRADLGCDCKVLSTGGLAITLAEHSVWIKPENIFEDLTLQGLFLLQSKI